LIWLLLKVIFTLSAGVMLETGQHGVHLLVDVKILSRVVFYLVLVCLESSLIWFLLKVVLITLCRRGAGDG